MNLAEKFTYFGERKSGSLLQCSSCTGSTVMLMACHRVTVCTSVWQLFKGRMSFFNCFFENLFTNSRALLCDTFAGWVVGNGYPVIS